MNQETRCDECGYSPCVCAVLSAAAQVVMAWDDPRTIAVSVVDVEPHIRNLAEALGMEE